MRVIRRVFWVALPAAIAACSIDALLEGPIAPDARISMSVEAPAVSALQGGVATLGASITRLGDFHGAVEFSLTELPAGVVTELGPLTTAGAVTSTVITFRVGASVPPGAYLVTVRGAASPNGATNATVELRVSARPRVTISAPTASLTILQGGTAPLEVAITRTAFDGVLAFSVVGTAGISANTTVGAGSGGATNVQSETVLLTVASTVAPGAYTVTLRATSSGIADADVAIAIVVSAGPLQLIVRDFSTPQASIAEAPIIVNRNGAPGDVQFSIEGTPPGVAATFTGGTATSTSGTLRLTVGATVTPGMHPLVLRGKSAGIADVVTPFTLTISASNVAVTLVPSSVTVLQGAAASATLTIIRSAFAGAVAIELTNVPPGIAVSVAQASLTGTTTTLTIAADRAVSPGTYVVTVRAIPEPGATGAPALNPVTSTLSIIVVATPAGSGNVVLDWSRCTAPQWVGAQDGTGPWIPLAGAQGIYRFSVATRGGFAYVDNGTQIIVRYGTVEELARAWIDLCPPALPVMHTATGTALHLNIANSTIIERFVWHLGGGAGTSTYQTPVFTISGIQPGTHDLIGWGTSAQSGQRGYLRRDVPEGQSLGTVDLLGDGSFPVDRGTVSITGFAAEAAGYTTTFLSGPSCIADVLVDTTLAGVRTGTVATTQLRIPADLLRPDDFHQLAVRAASAGGTRTLGVMIQSVPTSVFALPPQVTAQVSALAGSYKRLSGRLQTVPAAYDGAMTLTYSGGGRTATVTASMAYLGAGALPVDMPELGGVTGFPATAGIPASATGTWSLSVDGSNGAPACTSGWSRWSNVRNGVF